MEKKQLSFMDGLQFGCGFWTAGFIFTVIVAIFGAIAWSVLLAGIFAAGAAG